MLQIRHLADPPIDLRGEVVHIQDEYFDHYPTIYGVRHRFPIRRYPLQRVVRQRQLNKPLEAVAVLCATNQAWVPLARGSVPIVGPG